MAAKKKATKAKAKATAKKKKAAPRKAVAKKKAAPKKAAAKKKAAPKKAAAKKKAAPKKKAAAKKKAAPKKKAPARKKAAAKKKAAPSLTAKNFKWNEGLVGRAAKRKEAFPTMDQVEAAHLKAVLDAYGGDIQRTGLALGIARSTVYRKMKRYKLR